MKPYHHVEMFKPRRSVFNLSEFKIMDADMGLIYPVYCKKMVPGDHFKLGHEIVLRMNPSVAPLMHEINLFLHAFFCPLRPMWPKPIYSNSPSQTPEPGSWEDFMTGGPDGLLEPEKPKWKSSVENNVVHTLWDAFGFPVTGLGDGFGPPYPDAWPKRAYNWVWNEYYRDQTYMEPVDLDEENLLYRCWEKDYFTSALPWQQRGQAPALPISGVTNAEFLGYIGSGGAYAGDNVSYFQRMGNPVVAGLLNHVNDAASRPDVEEIRNWFNNNRVDLANISTFDVNDLRLAFQTQKFLERNARAGARYTEFLRAHWGVSPRDDRLQRPEYIGGARMPVIISEVLQTSSTDSTTPQGNLAGHGMALDRGRLGSYYAQEFGVVLVLMSIMPRPVYQQGIDREWLGETRYDELLPEFVNLSEQAILSTEIQSRNDEVKNRRIFGFQGRFDEYRVGRNRVVGLMRNGIPGSLAFWHVARYFDYVSDIALNEEFLLCKPRKDWLAVPTQPAFVVTAGISNRAVRPLPVVGTPGLIDHH